MVVNEEVRGRMTALLDAPDELAGVLAVYEARDKAEEEAEAARRKRRLRWRAQMGHQIFLYRQGIGRGGQARVMKRLDLSREALRQYEMAYQEWLDLYGFDSLYEGQGLQQAS
jgi:hypothetical protein